MTKTMPRHMTLFNVEFSTELAAYISLRVYLICVFTATLYLFASLFMLTGLYQGVTFAFYLSNCGFFRERYGDLVCSISIVFKVLLSQ